MLVTSTSGHQSHTQRPGSFAGKTMPPCHSYRSGTGRFRSVVGSDTAMDKFHVNNKHNIVALTVQVCSCLLFGISKLQSNWLTNIIFWGVSTCHSVIITKSISQVTNYLLLKHVNIIVDFPCSIGYWSNSQNTCGSMTWCGYNIWILSVDVLPLSTDTSALLTVTLNCPSSVNQVGINHIQGSITQ